MHNNQISEKCSNCLCREEAKTFGEKMKQNLFKPIIISLFTFAVFVFFSSCKNDEVPSFYSNTPTGANPKITAVDPPNTAIAAVTPITITGENFLEDTSSVIVYFGEQVGKVLNASPTQLMVISPNVSGSLKIKISTVVALQFSNSYDYLLEPAAEDFYPEADDQNNKPASVIVDKLENVYSSNFDIGVVQITPDGVSTLYSQKAGESFLTTMRFGPGGDLYVARGLQGVFIIPNGGGVQNSPWVVLSPNTIKISQIEFDPIGNLWASGKNSSIYRLKPDKSYTSFPFNYNVTALRIFNDNGTIYLYLAAQQNSKTTIMRIPIDANGDPGSAEDYFDFSGNYGDDFLVNDLTFAADGQMFLATDLPTPVVYVNTDKSTGVLYQDLLLDSPALSLAWGNGNFLYYVRAQINDEEGAMLIPQTIVKLNLQKPGAHYYGM